MDKRAEQRGRLALKVTKQKGRFEATRECAERLRQKAGAAFAKGKERKAKELRKMAEYLEGVAEEEERKHTALHEKWKKVRG